MDDDRNAPATRAGLTELEIRITERLTEVMRDSQTGILKPFDGFSETVQTRFKAQDDTEAGLKKRLSVLEERLLEVERRLNMPPAA